MKITLKELKAAGYSRDDYRALLLFCQEAGHDAFVNGMPCKVDDNRQFIAEIKARNIPDAAWAECYSAFRRGWTDAHIAKVSRELELGLGF